MTPVQLDCAYSMQLDGTVKARAEKENLRHLALMAREAMNRRGAELSMPADGARLWIWSDLHFDDERIRRHAKRPFPTIRTMNWALRDRWREAVAPHDTVVCAGDLGGRRNIFGRLKPPCANLPGRKVVVLGNHDFTRFRWRERPLGTDASVMTLVIDTDPPLLVAHVPLVVVPDGCVNVHGHHHDFRALETGPWINVSVEQTGYRPLDVRTQVLPLARVLVAGRTPEGATTIEQRVLSLKLAIKPFGVGALAIGLPLLPSDIYRDGAQDCRRRRYGLSQPDQR